MAELKTLINQMIADGSFQTITNNPLAQFGAGARNYIGATILPEKSVSDNAFRETNVRYRTIVANDGTQYSPAQKKGGSSAVGEVLVELGYSDIACEFTGRDFDELQRLLRNADDASANLRVSQWIDTAVVRALIEHDEKNIWEAIVNASVVRTGQNGFGDTITYSNPSGHRAAAGGTWTNDAYDPFDDILAMVNLLDSKGYRCTRIITGSPVVNIMAGNSKVQQRSGQLQVSASGTIEVLAGFGTRNAVQNSMTGSGLPVIETYDLTYEKEDGSRTKFLPAGSMVFLSDTGQDQSVVFEAGTKVVPDTLGYLAVGRAAGQADPGRKIFVEQFSSKPPRIEAQGWQATLPVITEPEAFAVITGIA
jgi:hypothetical protein